MAVQVEYANNEPSPALPSLPLLVSRPTLIGTKKTQIYSAVVVSLLAGALVWARPLMQTHEIRRTNDTTF